MQLVINELKKNFGMKEVLKGASFSFEEGKIYGLIGRNGAGKTTLFNCINQDTFIDGGEIHISENGQSMPLSPDNIGYVLSTPVVPHFLTAREFLKFFIDVNRDRMPSVSNIEEYLDYMKIDLEDRGKLMRDYSHGMKNKIQLLVNIMANPKIMLLDEPLTSFDVVVADEMKQLLRNLKQNHIIILSTHIMELALDLCDEIVILNNGILEEIERNQLETVEYKDKIIAALKADEDKPTATTSADAPENDNEQGAV